VLEGEEAISNYRRVMGTTNSGKADAGSIRADYASSVTKNAVHGSDSKKKCKARNQVFLRGP